MVDVDKKTVGINALITLGIVLASMVTPAFFEADKYYCEDRPELGLKECTELTQYYGLPNGKCWADDGNRLCRSGWLLVENDLDIPEEEDYRPISSGGYQEKCDVSGCTPI